MSLLLNMVNKNVPLHTWRTYTNGGHSLGFFFGKNLEHMAGKIFAQLSHAETVELLALEWEGLPQALRIELRTLCNNGNATGSVRKNIQRLNDMLKGNILSDKQERVVQRRVEIDGVAGYKQIKVNEAVAAAQRKYAAGEFKQSERKKKKGKK